ncbi:hypothetical protein T492DRAFT_1014766 [Pavlovales sp. CCMP2436]|nr:hypothetical protein T492DRAFT_1014766 [Pavlovales sp. CCMP2436]
MKMSEVDAQLYKLAQSVGLSLDAEAFSLIVELVRQDVKTSVIMQMLREMKDAKIRAALAGLTRLAADA